MVVWPEERKSVCPSDTCTPMSAAVEFTVVERWSQFRCPSVDEWRKEMWYICTIRYYLAIRKNEILSCAAMEDTTFSETGEAQKITPCVLIYMQMLKKLIS